MIFFAAEKFNAKPVGTGVGVGCGNRAVGDDMEGGGHGVVSRYPFYVEWREESKCVGMGDMKRKEASRW